jgi:hypothetical protein
MLSVLVAAQVQLLVLGACVEGSRASCSLPACAIGEKYCTGGVWDPCECLIASCDDGNPCTRDGVNPAAFACTHTALSAGTPCSDNNACTVSDACTSTARCVGIAVNLDDGNPCTADTCNSSTGPAHTPVAANTTCDDRNLCTLSDRCDATGHCVGTPKSMDDGDACTFDRCDPATGVVTHPPAASDPLCSSGAYFCYDKYGNVTKRVLCVQGQPCDLACR